jgi:hypothetical protein
MRLYRIATVLLAAAAASFCQVSDANVRSAAAGHNVVYPDWGDLLAVAEAVGGVIHKSWTIDQAVEHLNKNKDRAPQALFPLA